MKTKPARIKLTDLEKQVLWAAYDILHEASLVDSSIDTRSISNMLNKYVSNAFHLSHVPDVDTIPERLQLPKPETHELWHPGRGE